MALVLFDSYVFVRSLIDPWAPYSSMRELPDLSQHFTVRLSPTVADESIRILLGDSSLRDRLASLGTVAARDAYPLLSAGIMAAPTEEVEIEACADPRANTLLAEALALAAEFLITGNQELIDLDQSPEWRAFKDENHIGLRIMDAEAFLGHVMETP